MFTQPPSLPHVPKPHSTVPLPMRLSTSKKNKHILSTEALSLLECENKAKANPLNKRILTEAPCLERKSCPPVPTFTEFSFMTAQRPSRPVFLPQQTDNFKATPMPDFTFIEQRLSNPPSTLPTAPCLASQERTRDRVSLPPQRPFQASKMPDFQRVSPFTPAA